MRAVNRLTKSLSACGLYLRLWCGHGATEPAHVVQSLCAASVAGGSFSVVPSLTVQPATAACCWSSHQQALTVTDCLCVSVSLSPPLSLSLSLARSLSLCRRGGSFSVVPSLTVQPATAACCWSSHQQALTATDSKDAET